MPELPQILGSLFSDIAQSVFTSDLYSRDISRYYEQDPMLRHFPVPRTEISELELQLKFAISGLEINPAQTAGRQANSATIFLDFTYTLSADFHDKLYDALVELKTKRNDLPEAIEERTQWPVNLIYLRQDLLKYFQNNMGILIKEGVFQIEEARAGIRDILEGGLNRLLGEKLSKQLAREKKNMIDRVTKAIKLDASLRSLEQPLKFAWNTAGDLKVDVEITAEKLNELSSEHLSFVHVRTRVRNYIWSEVEHEGRKWFSLNPE